MNQDERDRMVDRLLNEVLAPQEIEPRAGLEQRILANLRAQPEPWPWWRWMMLWVPAAAAVVLLAIILRPTRPAQPTKAPDVVERQSAPPVVASSVSTPEGVVAHRKPARDVAQPQKMIAAAATTASLPRQTVFPSPVPLTPEETMLLTLLRRNPSQAVLVAREQAMEWERILNNFQNGEAEAPPSVAAPDMR